jgi:hypothetical protein
MAEALASAGAFDSVLPDLLRTLGEETGDEGSPAARFSRLLREHPRAPELAEIAAAEGAAPAPPEILLARVRLRGLRLREEELQQGIRRAQEAGNRDELDRFLRERQQLAAEKSRLERVATGRTGASSSGEGEPAGPETGGQT